MPGISESHVPVALFVYARHALLPRTLDCLRRNGVATLYVFSDGAAEPGVEEDVERVRRIVAAVDWAETVIVERETNLGLSTSICTGLDAVFADHTQAIVIEDDVCVAPEFCEYARLALRHYEHEAQIAGITGLRYPFRRAALAGYPFDVFMSPRFSSWGWATWRDRWQRFSFDFAELRERLSARANLHLERAGADMPWMIEEAIVRQKLTGAWDVACAANMLLDDKYFVTPTWNMVESSGFIDGTHHTGKAPAWTLAWEPQHKAELDAIRFAPAIDDSRVLKAYSKFFAPPRRQALLGTLARLRARSPI